MHLPELPTIFVKGGEERKVYFTVQARELIALGWTEKGKEKPVKAEPKKAELPKTAELKAVEVKAEPKPRVVKPKIETTGTDK
jgi:hypothetical protein